MPKRDLSNISPVKTCSCCGQTKSVDQFDFIGSGELLFPLEICKDCSDEHLIEDIDCNCTVCHRKLPSSYFGHYRTRFKSNGMRLRVNRNCKDCSKKESAVLSKIKKDNVVCLFREPQFPSRIVQTVIQDTNAKEGELDPVGFNLVPGKNLYFELINNLSKGLRNCLEGI